eukprot:TRINITY_DN8398_c0_g1_i1.p1 TRINITY_DN8398_c0_g1~~TRINITY_DN8398_c0_g1_i1.p1  ORF type:complete len:328 (-),score=57.88 TRINITY_DN8398_c0_g1_i1:82-1065(-)
MGEEPLMETLKMFRLMIMGYLTDCLGKMFQKNPRTDLRGLLGGTDRVFGHLASMSGNDLALAMKAIRVLPMSAATRLTASRILQTHIPKGLVFGLIASHGSLVSAVRGKKGLMHTTDVAIALTIIGSSTAMRSHESWTPVCMPMYNAKGWVYMYVCFIAPEVCLVLMCSRPDMFYESASAQQAITAELKSHNVLEQIASTDARTGYAVTAAGVPLLRHFVYVANSCSPVQMTAPRFDPPYASQHDRKRLIRLYASTAAQLTERNVRVLYVVGAREAVLAWAGGGFIVMIVLPPLAGRIAAVTAANTVVRWARTAEDALLINEPPTVD